LVEKWGDKPFFQAKMKMKKIYPTNTFFASVSGSPVWLSTIVLAEIECGRKVTPKIDVERQNQVRREMSILRLFKAMFFYVFHHIISVLSWSDPLSGPIISILSPGVLQVLPG